MLYERAASLVVNRGYGNVATFSGGIPAWKKAGYSLNTSRALPEVEISYIDVDEFRERFNSDCVVDIRIPSLYKLGVYSKYMRQEVEQTTPDHRKKYHKKIPLSKLSKGYDRIPKDRTIIIVDHNGKQSKLAAKFLADKGYSDLYCLKGGLLALQ